MQKKRAKKDINIWISEINNILEDIRLHYSRLKRKIKAEDQIRFKFEVSKPFTIERDRKQARLEPKAYCLIKYILEENIISMSFAEIGEIIYNDEMAPRTTIQNLIKRAQKAEKIGIILRAKGEQLTVEEGQG